VLGREMVHKTLEPVAGGGIDRFWDLALGHDARHDAGTAAGAGWEGRVEIGGAGGGVGGRVMEVGAGEEVVEAELGHAKVAGPGRRGAACTKGFPGEEVIQGPGDAENGGCADRGEDRARGYADEDAID